MDNKAKNEYETSNVLYDLEYDSRILEGLARAVQLIGGKSKADGISSDECIAIEILGEVMVDYTRKLRETIDSVPGLIRR